MINNQKGVAHIFLLLILLVGIIGGVYLTTQGNPLKLFSKATNPPIVFKNVDGSSLSTNSSGIPTSTTATVRVELTSTLGPPAGNIGVGTTPSPTPGKLSPCPSTGDVNDDKVITDADAQLVQNIVVGSFQPTADQLKRADVDGNGKVTSIDTLRIQRYIKGVDSTFLACPRSTAGSAVSVGNVGIGLTAPVGTVSYKIAENPTDLTTAPDQPYTKEPTVIDYTFKDPNLGSKFIWVEFKDNTGKTDRRSAQLEIVGSSGKPSPCPPDGDVNDDQVITDADAELVLQIVAGSLQPTTQQRNRVDVDGDGTVTSVDALAIQRYIKGEVSTFPACRKPSPCPPDGDVNDDQVITDADAQLVLQIVAGSLQPTTQQRNRVDVDGDGTVTSVDALRIQRYVAGEVSTFPACK